MAGDPPVGCRCSPSIPFPGPWICIRCGKVNAPHSMQCSCSPDAAAKFRFGYGEDMETTAAPPTWPTAIRKACT